MISKKSIRFQDWITAHFGLADEQENWTLITELERTARIIGHDVDTMGEVDPKSLHALIRAAKNLEAAYENKPG